MSHTVYKGGGNIAEFANISEIFGKKNSRYIGPQYKKRAQYRRISQYRGNFWAKNFQRYPPPVIFISISFISSQLKVS